MQYLNIEQGTVAVVLRALSPIDMIAAVQRSAQYGIVGRGAPPPWQTSPIVTIAHFVFYTAAVIGLQLWCRRTADRYLGRISQPHHPNLLLRNGIGAAEEERPESDATAFGSRFHPRKLSCDLRRTVRVTSSTKSPSTAPADPSSRIALSHRFDLEHSDAFLGSVSPVAVRFASRPAAGDDGVVLIESREGIDRALPFVFRQFFSCRDVPQAQRPVVASPRPGVSAFAKFWIPSMRSV